MTRLQDKSTVITGAARGIGLAIARRFAAEGARVTLADVDQEAGRAGTAELRAGGAEALFVACDVGDRAQVEALVERSVKAHGRIDVLVNNAAILKTGDILALDEADFDRVLRVNLKGYFLAGQAAARQMVVQGGGAAIVNLSSVQGVVTNANLLAYAVCKGGIHQLTVAMALALAPHRIRVNAIGPGSISTDMVRQLMVDDAVRRTILSRTPMGRLGDPDEVAAVAAFLASEEASYMTGQTVYVDGGRLGLNYTVPVPEPDADP